MKDRRARPRLQTASVAHAPQRPERYLKADSSRAGPTEFASARLVSGSAKGGSIKSRGQVEGHGKGCTRQNTLRGRVHRGQIREAVGDPPQSEGKRQSRRKRLPKRLKRESTDSSFLNRTQFESHL